MENKQSKNCCFYCEHLILDGMDSWCEKQHCTGEICMDKDVTNKYKYMISSFAADFQLATEGFNLSDIQTHINNKDNVILRDINILNELDYGIRHHLKLLLCKKLLQV